MTERDKFTSLATVLGIIIGVLGTCLVYSIVQKNSRLDGNYSQWRKLNLILEQVEKNYVDEVDVKKVTDAAVEASLAALDPHSVYLPPVELEESETELAGNFDGIGIQFNVPNDTAIVLEVIPGGPSEKAGLQPGDRILKVDSCNIAGVRFPQDSMVRRMKGKAGTEVRILVKRDNAEIPFDIKRGKIPVHCVDASFMINDTTGYIKLSKFSRTTYKEVSEAAATLVESGLKHLILDLRDNTGGYFDQALLLSDMFLPKGAPIVYLQGLHRKREDYNADGKGALQDVQLSVLINENSASSSEIFAGAIQDNDRGEIVGRRSFGKGLVQEPVYFTDNSAIRLTVARFHTPSGRCIQKPYGDDYQYDIYKRYAEGEMFDRDSIKIDSSEVYKTLGGRTVYGGGGIIPDVFVPLDTTKATPYFIRCNKKTTQMRFASDMFDRYKNELSAIDSYDSLDAFLTRIDVAGKFRTYAAEKDRIVASQAEWEKTLPYLLPQLRALVGRYSRMGDNAFYRLYLEIDDVVKAAM
ncbi:MAG: S41 family peptidase [Candidatus Cryptobacteroides sp.]|nr:S41 family peptidase [Candidatus Cryptobacteroides sp.]MDY4572094.1 S41 family peptidase [Candidatus Cryptobacteroides sp.]